MLITGRCGVVRVVRNITCDRQVTGVKWKGIHRVLQVDPEKPVMFLTELINFKLSYRAPFPGGTRISEQKSGEDSGPHRAGSAQWRH